MSRTMVTREFGDAAIVRLAQRACSLQGLPESQYHLLDAPTRAGAERGVYNVLAAMQSLGWTLTPPDDAPDRAIWMPRDDAR